MSDWPQVVAAIGAAAAALAAMVAAWFSYLQHRSARWPNLSGGVQREVSSGRLTASFLNNGPGVAVQATYMLVCGNTMRVQLINRGHLAVGERVEVDPEIFADEDTRACLVWSCTDVDWNVYVWSSDWKRDRFPRRRWLRREQHSMAALFRLMYPGVPIPAGSPKDLPPE